MITFISWRASLLILIIECGPMLSKVRIKMLWKVIDILVFELNELLHFEAQSIYLRISFNV